MLVVKGKVVAIVEKNNSVINWVFGSDGNMYQVFSKNEYSGEVEIPVRIYVYKGRIYLYDNNDKRSAI